MKQADTPDTPPPRKKMPAEVFEKIWRNHMVVGSELHEWAEWVKFDTFQGIRRANLSNVEVEGEIKIEGGADPLLHLVLSNCHLPDCEITNAKIRLVTIKESSTIGYLQIETSSAERFRIDASTIELWRIEDSATDDFRINNSTIGIFNIEKNSKAGNFWINSSIVGLFKVLNSRLSGLSIDKHSKLKKVQVWHTFLQRIEILAHSFVGHLHCQFALNEPVHIILEKSDFGHLDFEEMVSPEFTTWNISECKINRLTVNNFCNYGTFFFSSLKPLEKWEDFKKTANGETVFKDGKYEFEEINDPKKYPSTLRLTDSDLGKMQFINCDLRQFERFEFSNTKMLEVFVAGSQMPEDKAFCLPNDKKDSLKMAEQKRLAYGQFKKIYEARGDVAGSLPYLAYEMEAYLDELNLKSKSWRDHFGERWMLRLNRYSTNYGNDWFLGTKRTLMWMAICFTAFCLCLDGYQLSCTQEGIYKFFELVSCAPQYLNPFRDEDSGLPDIEKGFVEITPLARIVDYVSRVIVAYFVYQTIQAFRKLGKSSG